MKNSFLVGFLLVFNMTLQAHGEESFKDLSSLFPSSLTTGAQVLSGPFTHDRYVIGEVIGVYNNGLVQIRDQDDNKIYSRKLKYVHSRIDCDSAGNCTGDKVLVGPLSLNEYHSGRVEGIYTNDLVAVRSHRNGKLYFKKNSLVMKSLQCHADTGICLNDMVLSGPIGKNHYSVGTVTGIYSNGLFFVTDNDDGKTYIRKASALTKKP